MLKSIIKKLIGSKNYQYLIKLKMKKNYLIYFGSEFECPVCNSKIRKFLPGGLDIEVIHKLKIIGAGWFDNQVCPVCKAFNRDRLLALYIKRRTNVFTENIKLLHIAPEKGIQLVFRKLNNIDYLSSDLDSELADMKMDITDIQFPDNSFDVIICNHVLEHIPDDKKAMSELYRILRPNGWAILQVPISYILKRTYEDFSVVDPKEREKHFGQIDHVRVYSLDYFDRLKNCGFIVTPVTTSEYLTKEEIKKYGVIEEESIFYCRTNK